MTHKIENKIAKSFPLSGIAVGYIFLVFGIVYIIGNFFVGLAFVVLGSVFCFSYKGVQLDLKNKTYKIFTNYLGYKKGTWKSLNPFIYISIITTNEKHIAYSRAQVPITNKETYYDVVLLNKSHRKKLIIKRLKNRKVAKEEVLKLAANLNLDLIKYNPFLSESSKSKKRR